MCPCIIICIVRYIKSCRGNSACTSSVATIYIIVTYIGIVKTISTNLEFNAIDRVGIGSSTERDAIISNINITCCQSRIIGAEFY